ncbi:non-specific serine,threonine protein kinase [Sarracenia purpurea var. burkii]
MAKWCVLLNLAVIAFLAVLVLEASAHTDYNDVMALQDLYTALHSPPQLKGWKLSGGDPCNESWTGVLCSGSSVIHIKLDGLELAGNLGFQLSNLHSLKQLDVSSNSIQGEIPYSLPLNATHINLACNNFSANIPSTLTSMRNLRHLNLSHNSLSGPIGNVFDGLLNLKEMDLSYNNFTGDLPTSFGSLTNLNRLFLQNNGFTGSVILLAGLPLSDLNIRDNHFSGILPNQFRYINNLWFEGNILKAGENDPPWNFPLETVPTGQSIKNPPKTESSAIENYPSHKVRRHKNKILGPGEVAFMVGGGTLAATCAALIIAIRKHQSRAKKRLCPEIRSECSRQSLRLGKSKDYPFRAQESPQISSFSSVPVVTPMRLSPNYTRTARMSRRRNFPKNRKISITAKVYTLAELQSATNGFSKENLLGEGSLGSVYKAEFPNGQVLAVKDIKTVPLSLHEEEQFLDVIWNAARLRHPNIVALVGYCLEHGHHLLAYEYVNISLNDALHCEAYTSLSWDIRLRIALGVARALE